MSPLVRPKGSTGTSTYQVAPLGALRDPAWAPGGWLVLVGLAQPQQEPEELADEQVEQVQERRKELRRGS